MAKNVQITPATGTLKFVDGTQTVTMLMKTSGAVATGVDISVNGAAPASYWN